MKNIASILILMTFIFSCSKTPESTLNLNTPVISKFFDSREINELEKIVRFTDSLVIASTGIVNIDSAYHFYLDSIFEEHYELGNPDALGLNHSLKVNLLSMIDSNLIEKIWLKPAPPSMVMTNDTVLYAPEGYPSLDLNNLGSYARLIEELGKSDSVFHRINDHLTSTGGLGPLVIGNYPLHWHNKHNFNVAENRLWVAIFILTLEESVETKVARYLSR